MKTFSKTQADIIIKKKCQKLNKNERQKNKRKPESFFYSEGRWSIMIVNVSFVSSNY